MSSETGRYGSMAIYSSRLSSYLFYFWHFEENNSKTIDAFWSATQTFKQGFPLCDLMFHAC